MSEFRQDFNRAVQTIVDIDAEMARSYVLNDEQRLAFVAAPALGSLLNGGQIGTGKTYPTEGLTTIIGGEFKRVQGTADIMPADITGTDVWHADKHSFIFHPGPGLLANVLLVDELARMTPKAQAAFLELMQDKQATIGNNTYPTKAPFTALATYNPQDIDSGGNKINRANIDRFDISLTTDPDEAQEHMKLTHYASTEAKHKPTQVVELADISHVRNTLGQIAIGYPQQQSIRDIIGVLENHPSVDNKRSTIGGRAQYRMVDMARFIAMTEKQQVVAEEHIVKAAPFVLGHRVGLTFDALDSNATPQQVISESLASRSL